MASSNLLQFMQRDQEARDTAALVKTVRKKLPGIIAQKGGVIIVRDVRGRHIARTQEEQQRQEAHDKRAFEVKKKRCFQHGKAIAKLFGLVGKKVQEFLDNWPQKVFFSWVMKDEIPKIVKLVE
jgi:hypothetical protein